MGNEAVLDNPSRKKVGAFEKRVHEIDLARGILILLVLFDHLMNCFWYHSQSWYVYSGGSTATWTGGDPGIKAIFDATNWYWFSDIRCIVRYIALFGFCFVSGISCAFSRNNWKRAIQMIALWGILLVGARILYANNILAGCIDFNIIGVLAFSTLFYCFVQNCSVKGIIASSLIWFLMSTVIITMLKTNCLNSKLYLPVLFEPNMAWNQPPQVDWLPLVPYIFFFFLGAIISKILYADKQSKFPTRHNWERPFCFVGRHTLIIYLAHQIVLQPIFYGIGAIIKAVYGYK